MLWSPGGHVTAEEELSVPKETGTCVHCQVVYWCVYLSQTVLCKLLKAIGLSFPFLLIKMLSWTLMYNRDESGGGGGKVLPVSLHPPASLLPESSGQKLQVQSVCHEASHTGWARCAAWVPVCAMLVTHCWRTRVESRRVGLAASSGLKSLGDGSTGRRWW